LLTDKLFEDFYPLKPVDELSTPGFVFLIEDIALLLWGITLLFIQYQFVVPSTSVTIKKASITALRLGLIAGVIFLFGSYFIDKAPLDSSVVAFFRVFIQFESFWLPNLLCIYVLNELKARKGTKKNSHLA
jgi:hypothetical protein